MAWNDGILNDGINVMETVEPAPDPEPDPDPDPDPEPDPEEE